MNEKELKQLAIDIYENKVFGTWSMRESDLNHMYVVFMPFLGINQEQLDEMKRDEIIHIYEYYDKAGPRSVNGMPIFSSMNLIAKDEWEKVVKYIKQYEIKVNSFLSDSKSEKDNSPTLFDEI